MKKITIAGTSAVLAALPTIGVFAATGTTVTDTVQVTINESCLITATSLTPSAYTATITNGSKNSNIEGTSMSISCNDAAGWKLTAVGAGADSGGVTKMKPSGSGTAIATGTATSGATSNWAMKMSGTGVASGWDAFKAVPSAATIVATGSGSVSANSVKPIYQVYISATQQADTYTGKVTYTLTHPAT